MTMAERSTAVGTFADRADAERAIDELRSAGFRDDQIGLAMRDSDGQASGYAEGSPKAAGAATGALTGAGIGGLLGALAAGLIPGIGPVVAGGILAGLLGGAVVGAGAGGLLGWLGGEGIPEEEAHQYQSEFEAGRAIVTVKAEGRYAEAASILNRFGTAEAETSADSTAPLEGSRLGDSIRVPVREEQLVVDKHEVPAGEVEIHKNVVEEQQHMMVPTEREEVEIHRRPVNRPSDQPVSEGQTIHVPLTEESVEVSKRAVVREEVEVTKNVVQEDHPVSETVRREEVQVERKDWSEAMPRFRQEWQTRYGTGEGRWDDYEPGYRYGWEMSHDPRFEGRMWSDIEPELRTGYSSWAERQGFRAEPNAWERIRDPVRNAWENATNDPEAPDAWVA